ncbi:MAG: hypothetical protein O7F08_01025 [Deltaproteobacteria bacterium]|nr:hypothetical protein [Deltaproteobacteria bacterium]
MNDRELVLEVIRRLGHPVLDFFFFQYFRAYQLDYLLDFSPRRIVLKARRIGFTEVDAFDTLLTASGMWEVLQAPVKAHNVNIISKRESDALDYIVRVGRLRRAMTVDCSAQIGAEADADFRSYFELGPDNTTMCRFHRSGWAIQSDTQSEDAGRSREGHLKKDEASRYKFARQIVAGADKIPLSNRALRLSEFSTPNGTTGPGEVFSEKWHNREKYSNYSRHEVLLQRAIADGFPITEAEARAECFTDEEFEVEFNGRFSTGLMEYYSRQMLELSRGTPPSSDATRTVLGIDVASEVDLTSCVVNRGYGNAWFFEDTYLVRGAPYATDRGRGVLGQEDIICGIIWAVDPELAIIDASGDGAELYGRILAKLTAAGSRTVLIPHSFHKNGREWKATWCPRLRAALESGAQMIAEQKPKVYRPGASEAVTQATAKEFVDVAFYDHHYDVLRQDLMMIRRKQLASGITFESPRTVNGHGDSGWAAIMNFSICGAARAVQRDDSVYNEVAKLMETTGVEIAGADCGDYL